MKQKKFRSIAAVITIFLFGTQLVLRAQDSGKFEPISHTASIAAISSLTKPLIDCWPTAAGRKVDDDSDGIVDRCEQTLAEKFAPVVHHSSAESNFPTNVDWFLPKTTLFFYDDDCEPDLNVRIKPSPSQNDIRSYRLTGGCDATDTVFSNGTRSIEKQRTFFLEDVADDFKPGSPNPRDWTTYFHAYRNNGRGVTIQYWRFYAADNGKDPIIGVFGGHGGDWEGVQVMLDECLKPVKLYLMSHTTIDEVGWSGVDKVGDHALVFSEVGGHASHADIAGIEASGCTITLPGNIVVPKLIGCTIELGNQRTFVRQETWSGGRVTLPDGSMSPGGILLNLGEKIRPLNGQVFIQYSGIWGSPGVKQATSGYWNPAYNETQIGPGFFITAWCNNAAADVPREECHPTSTSR
jgi:hypothetical protein